MLLKAQTKNFIIQDLNDECIVYDTTRKKAHCLNPSVKWIWQQCDGSKTADEIAAGFQTCFGVSDATALVSGGLRQLAAANLISGYAALRSERMRVGITRREAAATASLLVPVITSILVPTPAAAASKEILPKDPKLPKPKGK